jgi:5'-nucleotidase
MIILLTNDDGFDSPGLRAMKDALAGHEIWIAAPDGERSGTSHSITIKDPVRFTRMGEREYACSGTPADCILFSFLGAVPVKPDIVISGINIGPNLGTDILYSGTAAAARQAALMGCASIAVSLNAFTPPFHFAAAASFVSANIGLFASLWSDDHFINVNVPNEETSAGIAITHPSKRIYEDKAVSFSSPSGHCYYFLSGSFIGAQAEEGSDWEAVSSNNVSVSPIYLHPVNMAIEDRYRKVSFHGGGRG